MTEQNNPYQAPSADVIEKTDSPTNISTVSVSRPIGAGWTWIKDAFALFKPSAFLWIGLFIVYMVIMIIAGFIPILGTLFTYLAGPLFIAGIAQCAYDQDTKGEFEIGTLFSGFSHQTSQLLIAGLMVTGLMIVCFIPAILTAGAGILMGGAQADSSQYEGMGAGMALGVLISVALIIPVTMSYFFAPALIKLNEVKPVEAFKLSFFACLKNILPYLWYGIIAAVLVIVGAIPLGLGLLVVLPVLMITMYTSYKDIFSG